MGIDEILLEDSLKADPNERKGDFFTYMIEFFRNREYQAVERIYLKEMNALLPDRFYKLAIKHFLKDYDLDAAINTADYHHQLPQNVIPESPKYKIKQETLAVVTKRAFETGKYTYLRRFSDNHPDVAEPIIYELWQEYCSSGEKEKARMIHWFLPEKEPISE